MKFNTLDLHGIRHSDVNVEVKNYLFLNQEDCPILIICGNSQKMISLVEDALNEIHSSYETGYRFKLWNNNGEIGLKMSDYSLILKNCNLVNEDSINAVDIGIKGEQN